MKQKISDKSRFLFLSNKKVFLCLLCASSICVFSEKSYGSSLFVSSYDHKTDAIFDIANSDGSLKVPYQNFQPGTQDYEWKDITPYYHALAGLGVASYWYEARDSASDYHYVMNDFVGRTINLGGTLDNWFYWEDTTGEKWGLQLFGEGVSDNVVVWKGVSINTTGGVPVLNMSSATRVYGSGIIGAYEFGTSPNLSSDHTVFELQIPYAISPQAANMIWFGDPYTDGTYYSFAAPEPSTTLLIGLGIIGIVYANRRKAHFV